MKKLLVVLFYAYSLQLVAQQEKPKHFFWGVLAGIEQHRLSVQSITGKTNTPEALLAGAEKAGTAGALLGAFGRWQLSRDLAIQTELLFSAAQNTIRFFPQGGSETHRFLDAEIPLHFVVTNTRKNQPLRASFLVGGRVGWNFASRTSEKLNLYSGRTAADIGLGAEIRLRKCRIQPEVVYSYGLNNLHNYLNTAYDPSISSIVRDRITVRVLVWR